MTVKTGKTKLNRIEKRAIEAQAIAPFIKAVAEKIGREEAMKILLEINQQEAFQRGKNISAQMDHVDIEALVDEVAGWGRGAKWEMDVIEQTSTTYFFNVTYCPYYEKYKELDLEEFGVGFSCCRDEPFARGFNPNFRLARTQTIMEGGHHCDFRYYLGDRAD